MWGTETVSCCIPSWLLYSLVVGLLLYLWGIWPYLTTSIDLPGPKPSPFVGNIIQMGRKGLLQASMENTKKYGKIYVSWLGRSPTVCIADPDIVKQICVKDFHLFNHRKVIAPLSPVQKSMIVFLSGERWKFVRTILSPTFSSGKLRQMGPMLDLCLKRMVENLSQYSQSGESFDVKTVIEGMTMEVIGAVAFGIQTDTQKDLNNQFVYYCKKLFQGSSFSALRPVVCAVFPFLRPVFEALGLTTEAKDFTAFAENILTQAIQERRNEPTKRKDLLQLLLDSSLDDIRETIADKDVDIDALKLKNTKGNEKLTDVEVISQTILFMFAGFETTASALSYLAYNLAVYPECQEKLIEEIDEALHGSAPTYDTVMTLPYLDQCLCETQRLYPAIRGTSRATTEPVTVKDIHIPANTSVLLEMYALQHDEKYWPDPEKFDPERWSPEGRSSHHPYTYFPFGVGPRNCVGMRLALMEAKMAAVTMLQNFRFLRVRETQVPLTMKKGIFIQPENGIILQVQSRG